ncbi:hypothetical protein [Clostridium sp.]|uniref:hypothetical protein n=1 Tax=Clostridium sp. TaxID=1506 RepID=UPI003464BA2B
MDGKITRQELSKELNTEIDNLTEKSKELNAEIDNLDEKINDEVLKLSSNKADKVIKDDTINKKYTLGIKNGLLYYREVQ